MIFQTFAETIFNFNALKSSFGNRFSLSLLRSFLTLHHAKDIFSWLFLSSMLLSIQ